MLCDGVESVFGCEERLKTGEHAGHRLHSWDQQACSSSVLAPDLRTPHEVSHPICEMEGGAHVAVEQV